MKTFRFSIPVTFRFSVEADTQEVAQEMARSVIEQLAGDIRYIHHSIYPAVGALSPAVIHGPNEPADLDNGEEEAPEVPMTIEEILDDPRR